ncbi:MAG: MarR family transcriptional regulator [bacterium]|nr:MarR family transcriptional regulator [bacterium]
MMHYCLFFTSQAFCRSLNRMAEEEMAPTGLAPSQTYLLMIIIETPGITPKELSEHMQLAPSTVTRFIDKFVARKLVTRESDGKLVKITATEAGRNLSPVIKKVWADLYQRYSNVLGKERGDNLAIQLDAARKDLES